ncbi:HAD-IIB family hydrolase [candidate division WWE3 bacterium]|uniref:HAD-IIB family hydrolase n=1 Tax=candidate division WWE3 bacterium TaxID=2053526 RepID=A0A955RQB3_UNCKA|nr:HAD-IIB family hydrolase [candidate division WWE3 bacterium]
MKPKLIVFDIDGVLVHSDGINKKVISPEIKTALESLSEHGVKWTVISGRGYLRALLALDGLRPSIPLIVEGIKIVSPEGKTLVYHQLESDVVEYIAPLMTTEHVEWSGFCPLNSVKYDFWTPEQKFRDLVLNELDHIRGEVTEDPEEFVYWLRTKGTGQLTIQAYHDLKLPDWIEWTYNEGAHLVYPKGKNKGTALEDLTNEMGISLDDTAVFGNGFNDVEMAEIAGTVVAVGNRVPRLIELSDMAIASPDDVPKAIYTLIK